MLNINVVGTGKVRREVHEGRQWLVCPFTSLSEGVLAGSNGPLMYDKAVIAKDPAGTWDGVAVTLGHPTGPQGQPLSAADPNVRRDYQVGTVFRDAVTNGKRTGEAWFCENTLKSKDPSLHKRLVAGQPVSVSTGIFVDIVPEEGRHKGTPYVARVTNMIADHLAILFEAGQNQKGACPLPLCGVNTPPTSNTNNRRKTVTTPATTTAPATPAPATPAPCNCHKPLANYTGQGVSRPTHRQRPAATPESLILRPPTMNWNEVGSGAHSNDGPIGSMTAGTAGRVVEEDDGSILYTPDGGQPMRFASIQEAIDHENKRRLGLNSEKDLRLIPLKIRY